MIKPIELITTAEELRIWCIDVPPNEILEYARVFPEEEAASWSVLADEAVRQELKAVTHFVTTFVNPTICRYLSREDVFGLVAQLRYYNAQSVLRYYKKEYASIDTSCMTNPSNEANEVLKRWRKVLYLATAQRALELKQYIAPLNRILSENQLAKQKIEELLEQIRRFQQNDEAVDLLSDTNWQQKATDLFSMFDFVPDTLIQSAIERGDGELVSSLLTALRDIAACIQPGRPVTDDVVLLMCWSGLVDRYEDEVFADKLARKIGEELAEATEDYYQYAKQLLTPQLVLSGAALTELKRLKEQLSADDYEYLVLNVQMYIKASVFVATTLLEEDEDIEYLIKTVVSERDAGKLPLFLQKMLATKDSAEIPIITNLIQIIAEVF